MQPTKTRAVFPALLAAVLLYVATAPVEAGGVNPGTLDSLVSSILDRKGITSAGTYTAATRASLGLATTDDVTFDDVTGTGHSVAQTYAGEIVALSDASIDFRDGAVQTLSISADTTFTTTTASLSATHARCCRIKITTDGTQRGLTFPGAWKWIGTKPANQALSTSAYLYLTSDGNAEADVVARYVLLGTGA